MVAEDTFAVLLFGKVRQISNTMRRKDTNNFGFNNYILHADTFEIINFFTINTSIERENNFF